MSKINLKNQITDMFLESKLRVLIFIIFISILTFLSCSKPEESDTILEYALEFDGVNDYVNISDPVITNNIFTIEAWVKLNGPGGGEYHQNIIFQQRSNISGESNKSTIIFIADGTYQQTVIGIRSSIGSVQYIKVNRQNYQEWHHYAAVVDISYFYLFIDGVLVGKQANNQEGNYHTMIDYVDIGRHRHSNINIGFLNAQIDELRIWNVARTQTQIKDNMNYFLQGTEEGLVSYW